jgi:hypothetical protein
MQSVTEIFNQVQARKNLCFEIFLPFVQGTMKETTFPGENFTLIIKMGDENDEDSFLD